MDSKITKQIEALKNLPPEQRCRIGAEILHWLENNPLPDQDKKIQEGSYAFNLDNIELPGSMNLNTDSIP